jgi:hypothetical protein
MVLQFIKSLPPWTHPLTVIIITIILLLTLLSHYNDLEYVNYLNQKNTFCKENQVIELENEATRPPTTTTKITLYSIATCLAALGFVATFIQEKPLSDFHYYLYGGIFLLTIVSSILSATQASKIADYTPIVEGLTTMFNNTCYFPTPNRTKGENFFNFSLDPDLRRSIIDKYIAYKEQQNKNTYYVRADIEEELNTKFKDFANPNAFAKELVRYMNFPHDSKLIKDSYKAWQNTADCTESSCQRKDQKLCTRTVSFPSHVSYRPTSQPEKTPECAPSWPPVVVERFQDTPTPQNEPIPQVNYTPLILNWVLLIAILYYFIHPNYTANRFYLVGAIILTIIFFMLYYTMALRNNI